jgi:peptidoglycan hydrolase-like protein with peptidoglycan-binding domain
VAKLFPGPYMERGSKGPAVAVLQAILMAICPCTLRVSEINVEITGVFDEETEKAVRYYQQKRGLEVDGKCGPQTRREIFEQTGIHLNELPADIFVGKTVTVPPTTW